MSAVRRIHRAAGANAPAALLLLSLVSVEVTANERPMVFQSLGLDDGLSQSTVNDIHHDQRGFVWLATENGLNRFDGNDVTVFTRERGNPNALAGDYIWAIDEDPQGRLWFAAEDGGVAIWDPYTESFATLAHVPGDASTIASNTVRNVLVAQSGRVFVATRDAGVDIVDPATRSVIEHIGVGNGLSSLPSEQAYALLQDRDRYVWIGTARGLAVVADDNAPSDRLVRLRRLAERAGEIEVLSLHQDRSGVIWAGTFRSGLVRIDPVSERVTTFAVAANEQTGDSVDVRAVLEDDSRRLWVGTSAGLHLFDRSTETFSVYRRDAADAYGLSDDFIMSLVTDNNGLVWVGTRSGGADRWNPDSWLMGHRRPGWLGDAYVASFAGVAPEQVWVGSIGAELRRFDNSTQGSVSLADVYGPDASLADPRVMSLAVTEGDVLWVGTLDGGVQRFAPDADSVQFTVDNTGGVLKANGIMTLQPVNGARLAIGTYGGGIAVRDIAGQRWLPVESESPAGQQLAATRATAITATPDGALWVATDGDGLYRLNTDLVVTDHFTHDPDDPTTLSSSRLYAVHGGDDGSVWVGTAGSGLARVVAAPGGGFAVESIAAELPNGVIYSISPDIDGQLWLTSNYGIARFDPFSGAVQSFHREHGVQHEEFNSGAHARIGDRWLVAGGPGGFNLFRPEALAGAGSEPPRVALTGLELLNQPADLGVPLGRLEELELAYNDDVLTFEFAALNYSNPEHVRYQYQLVGFDAEPVAAGNIRRVTYTNLAAGDYEFRVSAALPNSAWTKQPLTLPVRVAAAPWRTPWAYALYALAIVSVIAYAWYRQAEKLRSKQRYAEQLEREVRDRTVELYDKNEQLAAANDAKGRFLARMSHEIRTPMNGVIGMTELLRATGLNKKQHQLANVVAKSSQALLTIINDILDLSKAEAGRMTLETIDFSLREVFDDVICLLGANARQRGVELVSIVEPDIGDVVRGDPVRIRQVLINLVGNALKFTEQGEVVLSARLAHGDYGAPEFMFEVSDTGVGIDEQARTKIFTPFTQADESTTRRFGGTGLGLSICRQLVELMGGEIGVDSEPGQGSTFWFRIVLEHPRQRTPAPNAAGDVLVFTTNTALTRGAAAALARNFAVRTVDAVARLEQAIAARAPEAIIVDTDTLADADRLALSALASKTDVRFVGLCADAERGAAATFVDVTVDKPVRWPVLLEALGKAPTRLRQRRHLLSRRRPMTAPVRY